VSAQERKQRPAAIPAAQATGYSRLTTFIGVGRGSEDRAAADAIR